MLDTNICIYLIKGKSAAVATRLSETGPGDVGLSAVTLAELQFGVRKSAAAAKNGAALEAFLVPLSVSRFDRNAAHAYGDIRATLQRLGTPIGPLDTMIAAHALSLGVVLVTNNLREFARVRDLQIEDWSSEVET